MCIDWRTIKQFEGSIIAFVQFILVKCENIDAC